jgi:hypothetical protein
MNSSDSGQLPIRSVADVPTVSECGLRGGFAFQWNRRQLIRRVIGGAMALSLTSLSVLPPSRRAYATHVGSEGYEIGPVRAYPNNGGCPPASRPSGSCHPACGPSRVCGGASFGPCCVQPGHHRAGYHKHNAAYPNYRLRPNECDSAHPDWDGWLWRVGSCGGCRRTTFRCHDGFARISGVWRNRICRVVTRCAV